MNLNILQDFRHDLYGCFEKAGDALFNAADALLTDHSAQSFAELTLAQAFTRKWCSLYAAFQDGRLNRKRLREVLVRFAPRPQSGEPTVLGLDASNIPRPQSPTAEDRGYLYVHNLPECTKPVTTGWQFSSLMVVPEVPSSWSYILDNARIPTSQTAGEVAAAQLGVLIPLLTGLVLVVADRYYGSATFLGLIAKLENCEALLRIKRDRVFYRPVPLPTGQRGRPRKHGNRFKCSDPATQGPPDRSWRGQDAVGKLVEVDCWEGLHFRPRPEILLSVLKVTRQGATNKKRDPKVSWFIWFSKRPAPLELIWLTYRRRFCVEHTYRFAKQDLLWTAPHLRTPDQFQLWTDLVSLVMAQLVIARPLVEGQRRPWESKARAVTPQQVRRAIGQIIARLGTPARPTRPCGKGFGRAVGTIVRMAPRFKVVKKKSGTAKEGAVEAAS